MGFNSGFKGLIGTSLDEEGVRVTNFYRNPVFMWNCHAAMNPSKGTACFVCHKLLFKLSHLLQRMNT